MVAHVQLFIHQIQFTSAENEKMYCYPIVGALIKLLLTSENTSVCKLMENEDI